MADKFSNGILAAILLLLPIQFAFGPTILAAKKGITDNRKYDSTIDIGVKRLFDENPLGVAHGYFYKGERFLHFIRDLHIDSTHINIRWEEIERRKGGYNWTAVDDFVKQLRKGDRALIRIQSTSRWGTKGIGLLPRDLERYSRFIGNLVSRTEGKVKYYEIDWEVDNKKHWNDTAENYVIMLKAFYDAVKKSSLDAMVIVGGHSGAFSSGTPIRRDMIDYIFEYGSDYYDMYDVHFYHDLYTIPYRLHWFQKRMEKYGVVKPIVVTEYGGPTPLEYPDKRMLQRLRKEILRDYRVFAEGLKGYPPEIRMFAPNIPEALERKRNEIQASEFVQRTTLMLSSGAKMVWYWNLVEGGIHPVFGKLGLLTTKGKEKYAYYAYQRMARILGDIEAIERLNLRDADAFGFKIWQRNTNHIVYVLWGRLGMPGIRKNIPVRLPLTWVKVKITDSLGEEEIRETANGELLLKLTDIPIFLQEM